MHSLALMDLHDTHDDLPQELVDAILIEVDDLDSLKACCLVQSRFRVPCQRILLDRITLSGLSIDQLHQENYGAVRTLLEESPQVATHIRILKLRLHIPGMNTDTPAVDADSLQWVLRHLVNVRQFTLHGSYGLMRWSLPWTYLPSALSEALLDFVSQRNLHRLGVRCISALSGEALVILLESTRSLSFWQVTVQQKGVPHSPSSHVPSIVQDLALHYGCRDLFTMLSYPYFRPYISTLRRVCFNPKDEYVRTIVGPAADTLEHIQFMCNDRLGWDSPISLPPLRSLRIIEFTISLLYSRLPFLLDTISALLDSHASRSFQEIVMTFPAHQRIPKDLMTSLDRALVAHPAGPCIRWRMDFETWNGATLFTRFENTLKIGLPETHALGRLVVEEYQPTREEWYSFP
ncbi:hypothetical protein C8R45DRAFT_1136250 [Mycena sanguinolenta]|nr:hypothetical protein C8R45DRAFT_1136250 [Mycena sanguinolenta]